MPATDEKALCEIVGTRVRVSCTVAVVGFFGPGPTASRRVAQTSVKCCFTRLGAPEGAAADLEGFAHSAAARAMSAEQVSTQEVGAARAPIARTVAVVLAKHYDFFFFHPGHLVCRRA